MHHLALTILLSDQKLMANGKPLVIGMMISLGGHSEVYINSLILAISGSELRGADATMPNGVTYLQLAETTWQQINDHVSKNDSPCRGGVFWYRDRGAKQANRARLLSTVSSLQYALLSARLYAVTGKETYLEAAKRTYDWVFDAKLVDNQGRVFDGTYSPRCWQIEKKEHSYNSGLFLGVAGLLYKATGDNKYMKEASLVLKRSQQVFTDNQGIIIDECEPENKCKVNQAAFKGIFVRCLGYLYSVANDKSIRSSIKNMVFKSVKGMAKTCNNKWGCNTLWTSGSPVYSDVHTQNTALELFNTLCVILGKSKPKSSVTVSSKPTTSVSPDSSEIVLSSSLGTAPQIMMAAFSLLLLWA